jgi:Zn-dependent peptidase ImmA (M78 family)
MLKGNISQDELLNYYNIIVEYIDIPYKNIRGFVDYYNDIYTIYVNKNISYYKKRKTILHELAHIELNQLCQYEKDLFAMKVDKYEDEADRYIKELEENL